MLLNVIQYYEDLYLLMHSVFSKTKDRDTTALATKACNELSDLVQSVLKSIIALADKAASHCYFIIKCQYEVIGWMNEIY